MGLLDLFKNHKKAQKQPKYSQITDVQRNENPIFISDMEKEMIYNIYKYILVNPDFIDTKLQTLVQQKHESIAGYETLVENFPDLIDKLWTHGYEETLMLCSEDRRRTLQLLALQAPATKLILSRKQSVSNSNTMFPYLVHLKALELFLDSYQITDEDLQDMTTRYPDELSLYREMGEITDVVYDIQTHDYRYPAIKIARVLSNNQNNNVD